MAHPSSARRDRAVAWAADTGVTLAVTLFVVVWTAVATLRPGYGGEPLARTVTGWVLVAVGCGALRYRHRRPVAVAAVTLLACCAYYPLSEQDGPLMVTFAVALYTAAAEGRFAASVALAATTLLAVGAGEVRQAPGNRQIDDTSLVMLAGWLISLVAVGRAQRTRTAYLHEAEQRALAAEREQEARARQSATEERLRIAREVHDVLGHSISLINVQAGAVLHRLSRNPAPETALPAAREALEAVRATSKDALRELRSTLGVLRQADEAAPTAPASGLDRLGELVERARSAGLDAEVRTEGTPRPLPPPLDLAAYRIVQESLTNVTRHARARTALITLTWAGDELRLCVEDDGEGSSGAHAPAGQAPAGDAPRGDASRGHAPAGRAPGSGIRGMTERARALGGDLTAHDTADGFRVTARLPLRAAPTGAPLTTPEGDQE